MKLATMILVRLGPYAAALLVAPSAAALWGADKATGEAAQYRLRIEGRAIERLVVTDKRGQTTEIKRPGESILLPAGSRVQEIELTGGFHCSSISLNPSDMPEAAANRAPVLKVGLPLTPRVRVRRIGRLLSLEYKLADSQGREYVRQRVGANPPTFTVSKDGRTLGAGSFEYG